MIKIYDVEYSHIMLDFIHTLQENENLCVRIWTDGSEIPFKFSNNDCIEFLKEAIKIEKDGKITWILYGIIMVIQCTKMNG